MMFAYIINMDGATERWSSVESRFKVTGIPFERLPAVAGRKLSLPIAEFDEKSYRRRHGKRPNLGQIGCYLSHIAGMKKFLETEHRYAILVEDDVAVVPELKSILEGAIEYVAQWDILRLSGFHDSHPQNFADLGDFGGKKYSLAVNFSRLSGTGAYMVTRHAAEVLVEKLLPITVPIDHAIDREWAYGLRAASVTPLPVDQESLAFASQLRADDNEKLPAYQRYWTVFPYRAVNEISRLIYRWKQLKAVKTALKKTEAK